MILYLHCRERERGQDFNATYHRVHHVFFGDAVERLPDRAEWSWGELIWQVRTQWEEKRSRDTSLILWRQRAPEGNWDEVKGSGMYETSLLKWPTMCNVSSRSKSRSRRCTAII